MKQLLIVNSTRALNAKTPSGTLSNAKDFSALAPGAIAFSEPTNKSPKTLIQVYFGKI